MPEPTSTPGEAERTSAATPFTRLWSAPYLLLSLAALFWSGNFVLGRAVHETVPPIALAFWRWTIGLAFVLPFAARHLPKDRFAVLRAWRMLLVLSCFGIACFNTMGYIGLGSTTALNGLLLQSSMPLMILLFTFLFFRERATPMQWLAILVSFAGVAIIAGRGSPATLLELELNRGDAWIIAAVACYAVYSALLRKRPAMHPFSFLAVTFAGGSAMLLPFYLWEHTSVVAMPANSTALLAVAYVGLFPSVLAYLCFNRGVELIGPNRAGQFMHLMPVFGGALAIVFLGEAFRAFHAVGIALIAAGIGLATIRPWRKVDGTRRGTP